MIINDRDSNHGSSPAKLGLPGVKAVLATLQQWLLRIRRSAFVLPIALLVAGLTLAISELSYQNAARELKALGSMDQVRIELARVVGRITDAETGQRGYLLTGGADYLNPYRHASQEVLDSIDKLQRLYQDRRDVQSQALLAALTADTRTRLSELEEVIMLYNNGRVQQARELMLSGIGRERMETIRNTGDALMATEHQRVLAGRTDTFDALLVSRLGVDAMILVSLLVLVLFLRQGSALDRQRDEQQKMLKSERDRLEQEVQLRTAELTELARHLETTREDERARLARELHDELGALLTAAKLDVSRIRSQVQHALPDLMPRVGHLVEMLNSGIALKRRIIEDLRPSTLDNLGLLPALEVLCSEFADRLGVPVHTGLEPVQLTPSAQLTIFRMVQESLNNIAKHARATQVWVQLQPLGQDALACVIDNGVGFDPAQVAAARHGLLGMRYRVRAEQGDLTVQASPGRGATVTVQLPQCAASDGLETHASGGSADPGAAAPISRTASETVAPAP